MPELDGVSIIAFASFAGLLVGWLLAPTTTVAAAPALTHSRSAAKAAPVAA